MLHNSTERRSLRYLVVAVVVLTAFAPATVTAVPSPPHEVFGTVTDQNGDAVSGATVTVTGPGGNSHTATTDANGYYEISVPADEQESGDSLTVSAGESSETTSFSSGASEELDFTVQVDSDGSDDTDAGGGGGGGGGGSVGGGDNVDVDEGVSVTAGISGTDATVIVDGESLSEVGFTSQTNLSATVTVTERTGPSVEGPASRTFATGADIEFAFDSSDSVETVRIGVKRSRLDELGVTADQLSIYHLNDATGEWSELDTTVVRQNDLRVVLGAPQDGFSEYAVFAADPGQTEPPGTPTTDTPAPGEDTPTPDGETASEDTPTDDEPAATTDGTGPGFTVVLALLALVAAALLAVRRDD